jgi:hypothetical protein
VNGRAADSGTWNQRSQDFESLRAAPVCIGRQYFSTVATKPSNGVGRIQANAPVRRGIPLALGVHGVGNIETR